MLTAEGHSAEPTTRFALMKFRRPALPTTLVTRPALHQRLAAGAARHLTVVVGAAGAGKSVLLADWAAARAPGLTSWLSCDEADADPVRFWTAFAEAPRAIDPEFGADAANLLAMDGTMSPDVIASIANDAARLPQGSAIVVDDFHYASAAAAKDMTDLVECWPSEAAQLVLSSRFDPPLRQQRLRMWGELCEIRDRDLYFSLTESRDLLARFGVEISRADLELLHQQSEGWAAALQMAALSLRGTTDRARVARALAVHSHSIADYFISEILDQQPAEVAWFMLDTSVLAELTADACAAVTGRQDAAALLRSIDAAHLFLVALDEERATFRYHRLVRQVLRAELHARDESREQKVQVRAAEWFELNGDTRQAARHFLEARQVDRALAPMQDQVMADFLHDPVAPARLDLSMVDPSRLKEAPGLLLALAAEMVLWGDAADGGRYFGLLEQASIPPDSQSGARFATLRSFRHGLAGQADQAIAEALAALAIQEETRLRDEWAAAIPLILMRVYTFLEDLPAVAREAASAMAMPGTTEPITQVMVPGALALAWFQRGQLAKAADAARAADHDAQRLGFGRHFFAVDYLRVLAGLALERRDFKTAERLTERALSITEQRWPALEFLALLDRAQIWGARGQTRDALDTVEAARRVLAGTRSVLRIRADALEALLRLSLGDLRSPVELAGGLSPGRQHLLMARVALVAGDHRAAQEHLEAGSLGDLTPRQELIRQLLLAGAAIGREDPSAEATLGGALHMARHQGFLNTVVTTAPQVTSYLIEQAARMRPDLFTDRLTAAAREVSTAQLNAAHPWSMLAEPLTETEQRILKLLPTSTYLQIADTLYVSRNTVKTHLRAIYRKLGASSRSQALARAADLRLI